TPGGPNMTWGEYWARARDVAAGLHELGLRRGDTLALMLQNRLEFHLLDAGAVLLGAIPFSIYNTAPPQDVAHELENSGARIAFVEDDLRERVEVEQTLTISALPDVEARGT